MHSSVLENLERVRERIDKALERSGRSGEHVTIVGVTKTFGPERVTELVQAGVQDIGENRVQEFLAKRPLVQVPCRWHLVGTLQRNKATKAINQFHLIHSLDSARLAETLNRLGEGRSLITRVLIEVNTSLEQTKHGFQPEETLEQVAQVSEMPFLKIEGLMTIGPLTLDESAIRGAFQTLFKLRADIRRSLKLALPELSMGMSDDFEIAVEEGATMVRLGRVLLGERPA
jgi:hypothetical protein